MNGLNRPARGSERGVPRRALLPSGLLLAGSTALAGCYAPGFHPAAPADSQGAQASALWQGAEVTAIAVGAVVWALIAFVLIRYRRRRHANPDVIPSQKRENYYLEAIYTAVPLVIVVVLFGYTTVTQRRINEVRPNPDVRVEATAFQWGWRFHYSTGNVTVQSQGLQAPELVLPEGQTTEVALSATDVVHAFYVSAFLFQRNAVPGSPTRFDLTPTRLGTFRGRCATFCGLRHTDMQFTVRVVSPEDFTHWLATSGSAP